MDTDSNQLIEVVDIDNESLSDNQATPKEAGRKQWEILDTLIEKYNKIDISEITSSEFMTGEWEMIGSNNIYWRKYLPSEDFLPTEIFLKIFLIQSIKIYKMAPASIINYVSAYMASMVPLIRAMAEQALIAKRNHAWSRLDSLEVGDIAFIMQSLMQSVGVLQTSRFLASLEKSQSKLPDLEYFCQNLITPWAHENTSREEWVKNLKETLGIEIAEVKPYSALKEEVVANLVNAAMPFFTDISTDLKPNVFFDDDSVGDETLLDLMRSIKKEIDTNKLKNYKVLCSSLTNNPKIQSLLDIHSDYFNQINFSPDSYRVSSKQRSYHNQIGEAWFNTLSENARNAAIWIILLTTGLRNVDLRNLKKDCLFYSEKYGLWFLKARLKKTKNTVYIPVGEPTVKAVKLLKWMTQDRETESLIIRNPLGVNRTVEAMELKSGKVVNKALKGFAARHSIRLDTVSDDDDEGTCHCVRATLGGYIGSHSAMAILILKSLFGHSNNLMPDQYIRHNPFVKKFRHKQLEAMHSQTARDIATSIVNKKISGPKADELLQGLEYLEEKLDEKGKLENDSLTEMDTHQKLIDVLSEIILADIVNEQSQTLLTLLGVICMRATNRADSSPCAASTDALERDKAGVSRAMFNALPSLPNPAQCIGNGCPDALMTEKHSMPLLEKFDWYTNVLRTCTDPNRDMDEDAKQFMDTYYPIVMANDMLTEANDFINKYGKDLRVLYADRKPEGYFDA